MEADWEFEIGSDAPVIEAYWPGFVNLRDDPERVRQIVECGMLPGLADTLLKLNGADSPVWTCKTDVFVPDVIDPDELAARVDESKFAVACYIDLLMRSDRPWSDPQRAEADCRTLCARMRDIPLGNCRVDVVVRRARVSDVNDLGATTYITACGPTLDFAKKRLSECIAAFSRLMLAPSVMPYPD